MARNHDRPTEYDAVLGSQVRIPPDAAVLGGLEAVKRRLASPIAQQRIAALPEALKYGQAGLELAIECLKDESEEVRKATYEVLLKNTQIPGLIKKLWTFPPNSCQILNRRSGSITAIAFSQDGKHLFSGSEQGNITVWNYQDGKEILHLKKHSTWVCSIISNLDEKTLISASYDHTISVWNWETGEEIISLIEYPDRISEIATHTKDPARIVSVATSRDGKTLVSGTQGKTIAIWNLKTGRKIHSFNLNSHQNYITKIALSPNGKTLASGGDFHDRSIKIWHLETGTGIRTLKSRSSGEITALVFTPDGQRLVSAMQDKNIKVWNWQTGKEIYSLTGHQNCVTSIALSFDGKILVSGSEDGTIKLWDLEIGKEICTLGKPLLSYINGITSLNISPDGKTIASGDRSGLIKLWWGRL